MQADRTVETKNRDGGLDLLKGVAILCVVAYHLGAQWPPLTVCCPIFFFVNGLLTLPHRLAWPRHLRRLLSIAALTVFWSTTAQLVWLASGRWAGPVLPIGNTTHLVRPVNNFLWFMIALFAIHCVLPVLKAAWDRLPRLFAAVTAMLLLWAWAAALSPVSPFAHVPPFDTEIGWALALFCLGGCMARLDPPVPSTPARIALACLAIVSTFASGVLAGSADPVWFGYGMPTTTLAVVLLWLAAHRLPSTPALTFVGSTTLGVYLTHWLPVMMLPAGAWWAAPAVWALTAAWSRLPGVRGLAAV